MDRRSFLKSPARAAAARFGFTKRGVVKPGDLADLVVFDLDRIEDKAAWGDPHRCPQGFDYIIVRGRIVVDHDRPTGRLPGRILSRGA
jgi:N-acyl-D-amino-acid deacylase